MGKNYLKDLVLGIFLLPAVIYLSIFVFVSLSGAEGDVSLFLIGWLGIFTGCLLGIGYAFYRYKRSRFRYQEDITNGDQKYPIKYKILYLFLPLNIIGASIFLVMIGMFIYGYLYFLIVEGL